jgi:hypothetical protein
MNLSRSSEDKSNPSYGGEDNRYQIKGSLEETIPVHAIKTVMNGSQRFAIHECTTGTMLIAYFSDRHSESIRFSEKNKSRVVNMVVNFLKKQDKHVEPVMQRWPVSSSVLSNVEYCVINISKKLAV